MFSIEQVAESAGVQKKDHEIYDNYNLLKDIVCMSHTNIAKVF